MYQMALIEKLENDNWRELLRLFFGATLEVLRNDPYQSVGSAVDDLRAWIRRGGVARIKEHLSGQMDLRQFAVDKKKAVLDFFDILLRENRLQLLELVNQKVIPPDKQVLLAACGLSELEIADLLNHILAGERPFEDWMFAHGHSAGTITEVYKTIDEWLMAQGILFPPTTKTH
jgi:hypothetical protein